MATLLVSTQGDNSDGLTWATAFNEIVTAFNNLTGGQDDFVIIDDEDHNQAVSLNTGGGTKTGGLITIQSRSGDPRICYISGTTTTPAGNYFLLKNNEATTGNPGLVIRNITFKDHYRSDSLPIISNSNTSDFEISNCICTNLQVIASAAICNGLIRQEGTVSKAFTIAGLTVTDCVVNLVASPSGNEGALFSSSVSGASIGTFSDIEVTGFTVLSGATFQFNGLCYFKGPQVWSGTNRFSDIVFAMPSDSYGVIKIETIVGYDHSITGTMIFDDVSSFISGGKNNQGLINVSASDSLTIDAVFEAKNCASLGTVDLGIIANLSGNSSLWMGGNVSIHDNSSPSANGFINNRGGDFTLSNAEIYNNVGGTGGLGLISTGGTELIYNCFIHDNTATGFGGGIACIRLLGGVTTIIHNCTFFNNKAVTPDQGDAIYILSSGSPHSIHIDNCIFWDQANSQEIVVFIGSPTLTVTYCDVLGGEAAITGETLYQNNIESDPLFNDNFTLSDASPCIGAGIRWWPYTMTNPRDLNGHYFWDAYVDIGAFSTWDGYYRRVPSPDRFPAKRLPVT